MPLSRYVRIAAIRVAAVPNIISSILNDAIFAIKQPMVTPGMAAGVKIGRIVSTSEILN